MKRRHPEERAASDELPKGEKREEENRRQRQEDEINSRRVLLIDRIDWKDGWPVARTPSTDEQPAPVV